MKTPWIGPCANSVAELSVFYDAGREEEVDWRVRRRCAPREKFPPGRTQRRVICEYSTY